MSCEACHEGDGRGRPPLRRREFNSLLFRASVSGADRTAARPRSPASAASSSFAPIPGFDPEVQAAISYAETQGTFTDGTPFQLRVPTTR